jgi:alanine dehydrogenase
MLRRGQMVLAFHHLAAAPRAFVEELLETGATLIGYEILEDVRADIPVLHAMSEIAGQLSVHVGAHYLETQSGGRGVLLGGATGIPRAGVAILGAGVVGLWAARTALGNGAQVTVIDARESAVERAGVALGAGASVMLADDATIASAVARADLLIGAILNRGAKTPLAVKRSAVETMKPGSVIIDVSIDQGGCVETSRPTTLSDPVYSDRGVTHYCVPNMASAVGHSASVALTRALMPFVLKLAREGLESAISTDAGLAAGIYVHRGHLVSEAVARAFGIEAEPLPGALAGTRRSGQPLV